MRVAIEGSTAGEGEGGGGRHPTEVGVMLCSRQWNIALQTSGKPYCRLGSVQRRVREVPLRPGLEDHKGMRSDAQR
jgi:hypothetical protein